MYDVPSRVPTGVAGVRQRETVFIAGSLENTISYRWFTVLIYNDLVLGMRGRLKKLIPAIGRAIHSMAGNFILQLLVTSCENGFRIKI